VSAESGGHALWPFALETYGRPGVEPILLELQDAHDQCVPYLLWALWLAAEGCAADEAVLARAADLARAWQDAAVAPLRGLRRNLKTPAKAAPKRAWETLREGVKALELDAERMLLQMLESQSPEPAHPPLDPLISLQSAARAWGGSPPPALLERLAAAAAPSGS
jgi:uncharacterized protein (TIGR02444 family)